VIPELADCGKGPYAMFDVSAVIPINIVYDGLVLVAVRGYVAE